VPRLTLCWGAALGEWLASDVAAGETHSLLLTRGGEVKRSTGHTHTHTDREHHPRHRHTHAHDKNNIPNPQTNTFHKYLTTLEGGATTVRAFSRGVES